MIVLLDGSINAGKTTVGCLLAARVPQMAHVEVDALREFVAFLPLDASIPINLENAALVTRNLVRHQFHVVLTYPLGLDDHAYLCAQFADLGTAIHTFTLRPGLDVALADRGTRALSDYERWRIGEQYAARSYTLPGAYTIDNGAQAPEETVAAILARLRDTVSGA